MKKGTDMFNFLKRLFGRRRAYLTNLRPCPCCGGRHIRYKSVTGFLNTNRIICDDCGFRHEAYSSKVLLAEWERIPRVKRRAE